MVDSTWAQRRERAEEHNRQMELEAAEHARWNPRGSAIGRRMSSTGPELPGGQHLSMRRRGATLSSSPSWPSWPATPEQLRPSVERPPHPLGKTHRSFGAVCQLWEVDEGLSTNTQFGRFNARPDARAEKETDSNVMGLGSSLDRYAAALRARPRAQSKVAWGTAIRAPERHDSSLAASAQRSAANWRENARRSAESRIEAQQQQHHHHQKQKQKQQQQQQQGKPIRFEPASSHRQESNELAELRMMGVGTTPRGAGKATMPASTTPASTPPRPVTYHPPLDISWVTGPKRPF